MVPAPLEVQANNVKKGEMVIIDVWTDDFITGGVDVWIDGPGSPTLEYVKIVRGHGQLCIDSSNLPVGTYAVKAKSRMYDQGSFEEATTTFTIS